MDCAHIFRMEWADSQGPYCVVVGPGTKRDWREGPGAGAKRLSAS
jgi:hypothetical protein